VVAVTDDAAVIDECRTTMDDIRYLAERCRDILLYRIELVLDDMAKVRLYDLPDDEPVSTDEFIRMIDTRCQTGGQTLAKYVRPFDTIQIKKCWANVYFLFNKSQ